MKVNGVHEGVWFDHGQKIYCGDVDAPPNSLVNSTVNLNVKTMKG